MSNLWSKYLARYEFDSPIKNQEFYTNYSLSEYFVKLPYIFDIEIFCLRLKKALINKQRITIYSDYDTDAVTATGVMYLGLQDLGFDSDLIDFYAPDRFIEGYGMNPEAVQNLCKNCELMISVDCGINSVEEAKIVLQAENCDLLITDHHHLKSDVPEALGVINPRLSEYYSVHKPKALELLKKQYPDDQAFLDKIRIARDNKNFLPDSITGVGVAWFSLVWLGYYLMETN